MAIRLINYVNNQKTSPALYTGSFSERPAAGIYGRLFMSIDTKEIFQDLSTSWQLLADAGAGAGTLESVTANGNSTTYGITILSGNLSLTNAVSTFSVKGLAIGGVLFPDDSSGLISQDTTNFFWDNTNNRLGIGTNTPSGKLDIHGSGINAILNGTGTNNSFLVFQNAGVSKWYAGNLFSGAVANDFVIYDAVNAAYRLYVHNTGVVNIPTSLIIGSATPTSIYSLDVTGSGKFTAGVYLSTFTAGSVLFTGATGIISQDNANFFWDDTNNRLGIGTASPNSLLEMRASGTADFEMRYGRSTTADYWKTFVYGTASATFGIGYNTGTALTITSGGNLGIGTDTPTSISTYTTLEIRGATGGGIKIGKTAFSQFNIQHDGTDAYFNNTANGSLYIYTNNTERITISNGGNVAIARTVESNVRLSVTGSDSTSSNFALYVRNSAATTFNVRNDGLINTGTAALSPYNYGVTAGPIPCYIGNSGVIGYNASTRESKTNIKNIENVEWLKQLTTVNFNKRKIDNKGNYLEEFENELHYGLIAEDVQKINADMIFSTNDGKLKGVHYDRLIIPILKLVQELNEKLIRNNIN